MFVHVLVAALGFTGPMCTRREALAVGLTGLTAARTLSASRVDAAVPIPKASDGAAYAENLQKAKEYKYAARPVAGSESEAFKAAEAKRQAAQKARDAGEKLPEESANDQIARLGLKAYGS